MKRLLELTLYSWRQTLRLTAAMSANFLKGGRAFATAGGSLLRRGLGYVLRPVLAVKSLKARLALGTSAVALAILLLTYSTVTSSSRSVAEEQARQHVEELLSYFSGVLAEAVAAGDPMQVHLLARALLSNGVRALSITDKNGDTIFSSAFGEDEEVTGSLNASEPFQFGLLGTTTVRGESYLHAASPIRFGKAPVGMLQLWLNRDDLDERIRQANARIYLIFSLGFLLLIILGGVALRTPFRALKRLTEAAERIGAAPWRFAPETPSYFAS